MILKVLCQLGGTLLCQPLLLHFEKLRDFLGIVEGAIEEFTAPEWWCAGAVLGVSDDDVVVGDAMNLPVQSAQREIVTDGGFPYEFLI